MSLKQYNWTDGEVITAEKLNRGGITIVGLTTEGNTTTLDMTLQEIYDAMGKGIVALIFDDGSYKCLMLCGACELVGSGDNQFGSALFRSTFPPDSIYNFTCTTNDSFPYREEDDQGGGDQE